MQTQLQVTRIHRLIAKGKLSLHIKIKFSQLMPEEMYKNLTWGRIFFGNIFNFKMNLQTFSMLSRSKILKADPAFLSIPSIIVRVVHRKLEPVISMLYAIHECPRTQASMHCSSENTSSLEFTRPIRIALNVMSEIWGGEHGISTRAVKVDWITVRRK